VQGELREKEQTRNGEEDWERVTRSVGAGFMARWDQHDPDALEQEVGPVTRERSELADKDDPSEYDLAWFGC
jgi:hypothetical protein